eukprot:3229528-Pleurochrysis_carterae.AAC.1
MRYESTQQNPRRKRATTQKCECQDMQMRMNDIQSRNLKSKLTHVTVAVWRRSRARGNKSFCLEDCNDAIQQI